MALFELTLGTSTSGFCFGEADASTVLDVSPLNPCSSRPWKPAHLSLNSTLGWRIQPISHI